MAREESTPKKELHHGRVERQAQRHGYSVPHRMKTSQPATTLHQPAKHRTHGGRVALLSSDVELMVWHNRTCGRPVHGVGRGRGQSSRMLNRKKLK